MKEFGKDMLSTLVFVGLYFLFGDIYIATGAAIALGIAQIVYFKVRKWSVDLMQWMSLGLVVVFGSATLYLHDPRFVMVKPSIIHLAIAAVMLRRGWMGRYLPPIVLTNLSARVIDGWGYAWAALMLGLGVANIYIAMTMSPQIWGYFITIGSVGAKFLLFAVQYASMRTTVVRNIRSRTILAADQVAP